MKNGLSFKLYILNTVVKDFHFKVKLNSIEIKIEILLLCHKSLSVANIFDFMVACP